MEMVWEALVYMWATLFGRSEESLGTLKGLAEKEEAEKVTVANVGMNKIIDSWKKKKVWKSPYLTSYTV